ncbi:MAG: hypothetical protein U0R44_04125 [Candidatus Micrarchaeia archaeon]
MTDLKRTIKCSNCGNEASITLSSELDLRELLVAGKCNRCGSSLQVSYGIVGEGQHGTRTQESGDPMAVNIDESLFTPDIPSDTLRDLMED